MLWTIAVILVILWLLGVVTSYTVIVVLARVIRGEKIIG